MSINSIFADRSRLLQEMQGMKDSIISESSAVTAEAKFSDYLSNALETVNHLQHESDALKTSFELGEDISLGEMMVQSQKATVAFTALVQCRNKLITAYKDIMNMPV